MGAAEKQQLFQTQIIIYSQIQHDFAVLGYASQPHFSPWNLDFPVAVAQTPKIQSVGCHIHKEFLFFSKYNV